MSITDEQSARVDPSQSDAAIRSRSQQPLEVSKASQNQNVPAAKGSGVFNESNVSGRKGDPSPRKELIGMDAQQRSGATVSIQQEDSIVNLDEGADSATLKMAQNAKAPRIWCALAFIFPPLGWVGFVIHRKWPKNTPRGKWAHRACAIGSLLAFLYTFVAAALVGHYGQNSPNENGYKGCGFGGPCPPFSGPNALQLK